MDHLDGRLAPEPVGRVPPPADARRARRGRPRPAGVPLRAASPARRVTNSLGKAFFETASDAARRAGRRSAPTARSRPATRRRTARSTTCACCRPSEDKRRSALDAMAYSVSVGLTAHLDQVLFPTPGPLDAEPGAARTSTTTGCTTRWLELAPRGEDDRSGCRSTSCTTRADPALPELHGAAEEPVPVLRRRHDDDRRDRRVGGADRRRPGLVRGAAARARRPAGATRTRADPRAARSRSSTAYEAIDAEYGIKDLRWMVHHVPVVTDDLLEPAARRSACGVAVAGFGWITSGPADHRRRRAVPADRRPRHPGRAPRRRRPHRAAEPVAAHLLRDHRAQLVRRADQRRPARSPARRRCASSRARTRGSCAWRTRSARSRSASSPTSSSSNKDYFRVHGRRHQEDPLGPHRRRRPDRARRGRAAHRRPPGRLRSRQRHADAHRRGRGREHRPERRALRPSCARYGASCPSIAPLVVVAVLVVVVVVPALAWLAGGQQLHCR